MTERVFWGASGPGWEAHGESPSVAIAAKDALRSQPPLVDRESYDQGYRDGESSMNGEWIHAFEVVLGIDVEWPMAACNKLLELIQERIDEAEWHRLVDEDEAS